MNQVVEAVDEGAGRLVGIANKAAREQGARLKKHRVLVNDLVA